MIVQVGVQITVISLVMESFDLSWIDSIALCGISKCISFISFLGGGSDFRLVMKHDRAGRGPDHGDSTRHGVIRSQLDRLDSLVWNI